MNSVTRVAIVGAGTMGRRIAFGCVVGGLQVRLHDVSPAAVEEASRAVRDLLERCVERGTLAPGLLDPALERLELARSLPDCVAGADLVIESVPEDVELKRRVFSEIDRVAPKPAFIGSNTSSIPPSWLASATTRAEKVFNLNFGPPEHVKVEVMGHAGTASETIEAAVRFVRSIGLVPIVVNGEIVGYATNRIWRAIKKEVLFLIDRGYLTAEEIDRAWMLDWGTPIGPCGLMDKVGLDVVRDIELIYQRASGDPSDLPPRLLLDMIEDGRLGVKSGAGFYTYPDPAFRRPGWLEGGKSADDE
jgi:3-hydroxybutyryl-CoA dehydrogenase